MRGREETVATSSRIVRTQPYSLRHAWDVLTLLVRRDLRLRYRNSALGVMWSVLLPVAQAAVLVFVFQILVPLKIEAYPGFVFAGLLPWTWFSNSVVAATGTLIENRELVRHPGFWPPALVAAAMISNLILFLAALPILLVITACYGRLPNATMMLFPLLVVLESLLIMGMGLITATLNVFYRDVAYVVTVGLMLLFYLTPVFYEAPQGNRFYAIVMVLNPMAVLVDGYRATLFGGTMPELSHLAVATLASLAVVAMGWHTWRRHDDEVFDAL